MPLTNSPTHLEMSKKKFLRNTSILLSEHKFDYRNNSFCCRASKLTADAEIAETKPRRRKGTGGARR